MSNRKARLARLEHYRKKEADRQRGARLRFRAQIQAIKTKAGCMDCGETHPACLQFHHTDPTTKLFRINRGIAERRARLLIMKEIKKCIVLCANCHAKRHWLERRL